MLVGTTSVEQSESLSEQLQEAGIAHEVAFTQHCWSQNLLNLTNVFVGKVCSAQLIRADLNLV